MPARQFRQPETLLFIFLFAIHLAPIWLFRYFPSQDGPAHLENASILRLYNRADTPIFHKYFEVNTRAIPNWFGHLLMAGLLYVSPPRIAEKLLVSGYVILLPLSLLYALRGLRPGAGSLAILSFPLIYNCLLHYGFYNFCYSLAIFFFLFGYWVRNRQKFGLREAATLTGISLGLYFCHLVSWVLALMSVAVMSVFFRARAVLALAAFIPGLILAIRFVLQQGSTSAGRPNVPFKPRWTGLYHFSTSVFSYAPLDQWIGTALAVFLIAMAIYRVRRLAVTDGLLAVPLIILGLYFLAPAEMSGGMYILERLNLYIFLSLLLWLGVQEYSVRAERAVQCGVVALSLTLLALTMPRYKQLNRYLDEYLSGMALIDPNTTLLPISFDSRGPGDLRLLYTRPLQHASGYIAADRRIVDLGNYEAGTNLFPVMFRPAFNPRAYLGDVEAEPPSVNLAGYRERTPGQVDYVLVWNLSNNDSESNTAAIAPQLADAYTLIFTSTERHVRLYRRTNFR